jgi:hypothetical protein
LVGGVVDENAGLRRRLQMGGVCGRHLRYVIQGGCSVLG